MSGLHHGINAERRFLERAVIISWSEGSPREQRIFFSREDLSAKKTFQLARFARSTKTIQETNLKIIRNASSPSKPGATPENFTGIVRIDNMTMADAPSRVATASVTFSPGARTVWHTHPAGQTIIVTAGKGWVQRDGGAVEEVNPGDTVFFAAKEKHWHGATSSTGMTHIAVTESVDGKNVEWLEPVSDEQHRR